MLPSVCPGGVDDARTQGVEVFVVAEFAVDAGGAARRLSTAP
jgi:hypothetical protein